MWIQSEILPLGVLMMVLGQPLERWQIIANQAGEADTISDAGQDTHMNPSAPQNQRGSSGA